MSATLIDTPTQGAPGDGIGAGPARILADLALLAALLAVVFLITDGWFSADEVVMRQQSAVLVETDGWTVEPDVAANAVDPDRRFALLARSDRVGNEIAPYTKHPLAPILAAQGERLAGERGRYLPGIAAVLGSCLLFAQRFGRSRIAFWILVVGTTAIFHTTVLWAHGPALFFATAAVVLLYPAGRSPRAREVLIGSLAVAAVATLRSEGLLLGAALSVGMAVSLHGIRARIVSLGPLAASAIVYVAEPIVRSRAIGSASSRLAAPVSGSGGWSSRIDVVRIMLIEPATASGLGSLRILGAIALIAASFGLRTGRIGVRPGRTLLVFAGIFYGLGALSTPIPGLMVAMPLLAACLPWIRTPAPEERNALIAAAVFALAVFSTSYDDAGGGDWGARYLFVGVPLLALPVVPAIEKMRHDERGRAVLLAASICAVCVHVGILNEILGRSETVETVDSVTSTVLAERSNDPQLITAVSDERLSRFLYDRGLRGRVFHVPPEREPQFLQLESIRSADRLLWIDLPAEGMARSGQLIETHGSVSIRTEVRR